MAENNFILWRFTRLYSPLREIDDRLIDCFGTLYMVYMLPKVQFFSKFTGQMSTFPYQKLEISFQLVNFA